MASLSLARKRLKRFDWFEEFSAPRQLAKPYLYLPGAAGNYASTPDSAAVSITGDIDVRVRVAFDDWIPENEHELFGKFVSTGNQRSWLLNVRTTGTLRLYTSPDGTVLRINESTAAPSVADGATLWLRATKNVTTGSVTFYTSNDGTDWTQLGDVVAGTAEAFFDSTAGLEIGSNTNGSDSSTVGKVYYIEVRNGIDGPVVAKFDPAEGKQGASSFVSGTGETWTINASGSNVAYLHVTA